jgi:hypothetical protein
VRQRKGREGRVIKKELDSRKRRKERQEERHENIST